MSKHSMEDDSWLVDILKERYPNESRVIPPTKGDRAKKIFDELKGDDELMHEFNLLLRANKLKKN